MPDKKRRPQVSERSANECVLVACDGYLRTGTCILARILHDKALSCVRLLTDVRDGCLLMLCSHGVLNSV